MGEDGAGASPVSYRHNFLVLFIYIYIYIYFFVKCLQMHIILDSLFLFILYKFASVNLLIL